MTGAGGVGPTRDPDATVVLPAIGASAADPVATAAPAAAATGPGDGTGAAVARSSAVMALGSVISRLTGFVRTVAVSAAIGVFAIGDAYNLANTLPGMVYELLLGGVLGAVVVPLLVRARTRNTDGGQAYAQRLLSLAVIFLAGATLVAIACAPLFTALLTNSDTPEADRDLITTLSYLLLPMIFFYGMAALFGAVLNTRGHFAAPTFAPILNNVVVIAMTIGFLFMPVLYPKDAASLTTAQIALLGVGTTLGIIAQAAGLWPALRRVGFRWKWRWDFGELRLRELARMSAWMLVYVVVSQVALLVVLRLAQMAANRGGSGPAVFQNAFLIFMMAHGIIAVSIITALIPRMATAASEQRHSDIARHLSLGIRLTSVVLLPVTAAYLVLGRPLAVAIFELGNYGHAEAVATGWVIAVAGLGLVPFAISQLQLSAFYAMSNTRTPALISIPTMSLRIATDVFLFLLLPATWVAAGLMLGNAVSFVLSAVLGAILLRRRVGRIGMATVAATLGRSAIAATAAGLLAFCVVFGFTAIWGDGKGASVVQLLVGSVVLFGTYVSAAFALRIPEVRELSTMVRARIGR